MSTEKRLLVFCVVLVVLLAAGQAQVVREDDVASIAGLLESTADYNEFHFESLGGEILYATVDSSIYQNKGRGESTDDGGCGETHDTGLDVVTGSGCPLDSAGGTSHDSSGGCSGEGGSMHIKLEVYMGSSKICFAGRPVNPGWQRDPRLICVIPQTTLGAQYTLRVLMGGMGGDVHTASSEPTSTEIPYLLNASLRKIATTGQFLKEAGKESRNIF